MGWGYGRVAGRDVGYMVLATCDRRGCEAEIDRGLGYVCGDFPHRPRIDEGPGCGRYYCPDHGGWVGSRGGCSHRGRKAWGRVLSCMTLSPDTTVVCLYRAGHDTPHAWEVGEP